MFTLLIFIIGVMMSPVFPGEGKRVGRLLFQPNEMFVITNKEVYELEIRMRICVNMTNNVPDYELMSAPKNLC